MFGSERPDREALRKGHLEAVMSIHNTSFIQKVAIVGLGATIAACSQGASSASDTSAKERAHAQALLEESSLVLSEMSRGGAVPLDRYREARCVVVVPELVSGALVLGAQHGAGVVTCRTPSGWSAPAFVTVSGGGAGLQAGVQSSAVVMLVKNERGMAKLFHSSFELGANSSAAAGPFGRSAQAGTDASMSVEIVAIGRSRGLFAGVELNGAEMSQDRGATSALYGGWPTVQTILSGGVQAPVEVTPFLNDVKTAFSPS
jgi:SH3 domain-containing YSC84-like protein 1